jgi:hypothetical protein
MLQTRPGLLETRRGLLQTSAGLFQTSTGLLLTSRGFLSEALDAVWCEDEVEVERLALELHGRAKTSRISAACGLSIFGRRKTLYRTVLTAGDPAMISYVSSECAA